VKCNRAVIAAADDAEGGSSAPRSMLKLMPESFRAKLASPGGVADPPFARSEIFKKSEKKACQLSGSSINEGKLRTNQLIFRSKIFSKK
jgi:hypothetical protein